MECVNDKQKLFYGIYLHTVCQHLANMLAHALQYVGRESCQLQWKHEESEGKEFVKHVQYVVKYLLS